MKKKKLFFSFIFLSTIRILITIFSVSSFSSFWLFVAFLSVTISVRFLLFSHFALLWFVCCHWRWLQFVVGIRCTKVERSVCGWRCFNYIQSTGQTHFLSIYSFAHFSSLTSFVVPHAVRFVVHSYHSN